MQVYPAASLINYVTFDTKIFYIDPKPAINNNKKVTVIPEKATVGVKKVIEFLGSS